MFYRLITSLLFLILLPFSVFSETKLLLATDDTPGPPFILGEGTEFQWDNHGIEIEIYQQMAKNWISQ